MLWSTLPSNGLPLTPRRVVRKSDTPSTTTSQGLIINLLVVAVAESELGIHVVHLGTMGVYGYGGTPWRGKSCPRGMSMSFS